MTDAEAVRCLTFDMRGPTRLAGAGPLDGRVRPPPVLHLLAHSCHLLWLLLDLNGGRACLLGRRLLELLAMQLSGKLLDVPYRQFLSNVLHAA